MKIKYIVTYEDAIEGFNQILENDDIYVGVDTETTGLDPHTAKVRLAQFCSDSVAYVFDLFSIGTESFKNLTNEFLHKAKSKKIFIAHNWKFDIKMFWSIGIEFFGQKVFDTMLAAKVYECGPLLNFGLADICERYLGIFLDKTEQLSDWSVPELSDNQIKYAAKDTFVLKSLAKKLTAWLTSEDLIETFKLEMRTIFGFAMMEYFGIKLDLDRLNLVKPIYETKLEEAKIEFLKHVPNRHERRNIYGEVIDDGIDITSSTQVLKVLRELQIPNPLYDPKSTEEKAQDKIIMSTGSDVIKLLEYTEYPILEALLEHRKASKLLTSYIYNLPNLINPVTGRLHSNFNQIVSTGRSCLAKGTQVTVLGGYKNIEDIQVGDYVYTYTKEGKLTIRKVLNVWNKGIRPTVKVKWQSSGTGQTGELVCTPDHLFKTKHKDWVQAKDLQRYDKIYHLARRDYIVDGNLRPRLYGTHSFMQLEQTVIKQEYFKADSNLHIHHKNGVSFDNSLDNLEILTKEEHARKHGLEAKANKSINIDGLIKYHEVGDYSSCLSGKQHPLYKNISRFSLLKLVAKYKGRISSIPGDFATYKKKCIEYNIDYVEIARRYTSEGIYLSKGILSRNLKQKSKFYAKYKVDARKFNKLCEYYGLNTNHAITSVIEYIPLEVWDIEVEETNNFIANELCVHNSSSNPNVNQIPRPDGSEYTIRSCFIAEQGYKFALADYCVPQGTLIHTKRGLVPIELIKVSDLVYQDNLDVASVNEVIYKGELSTYELKTKLGYSLKATEQHRIRVFRDNTYQWIRVKELMLTDKICLCFGKGFDLITKNEQLPELTYIHINNKEIKTPIEADAEFAEFLGYIAGDGSFSHNSLKWVVCDKDRDVFNHLNEYAIKSFGYLQKPREYRGVLETGLNSTALLAWFRLIGASKESIPGFIFRSNKLVIGSYLRGLFESDGSVTDRVSLCTTSYQLMKEVHLLLLSLGIMACFKKATVCKYTKKQAYIIEIKSAFLQVFNLYVGFLSDRKQQKLNTLLTTSGYSAVYGSIYLDPGFIKSKKPSTESYKLLHNSINSNRPITLKTLYKLYEKDKSLCDSLGLTYFIENTIYMDELVSKEYYGEEECFDLRVDHRQTYISEGFISHNSQVELRVMAEVCSDENMLEEFFQQKDPYASTAAFVNGLPYETLVDINPKGDDKPKKEFKKLRQNAKAVRLGYNYAMGSKKFKTYAKTTYGVTMTQKEAELNRSKYFEAYPKLVEYHERFYDKSILEARTLPPFNRRRIWEEYPGVPALANLAIQGTSGDIQKLAIANIFEELWNDGFAPTKSHDVRLILTVHDELEIEAKEHLAEYARELLERNMIEAAEFVITKCPISCTADLVDNLAEKE